AAALVPPLALVAWASPAAATPADRFTAKPVEIDSVESAHKAPTSRLAQTDPALLGRTDSKPVAVLIKLAHDPVATYSGEVSGLAATSPAVTGRKLTGSSNERKYENYLAKQEQAFEAELKRRVPGAKVGQRLRTV